uniref:NFKB repressing factor n=1 Tax=Eptatretus burgeri TaxID=7764 RepID=A0A8C4QS38_EPTBU
MVCLVPSAQKSLKLHPRLRFEAVRFVPATSTNSEVAPLHEDVAQSFGKIDKKDEVTCKTMVIESKEHGTTEFLSDGHKQRNFDTGYDLRSYSRQVEMDNVNPDPRHGVVPQLGSSKHSHLNCNPQTQEQGMELTAEVVQTRNAFYQRLYKAVYDWKMLSQFLPFSSCLPQRINHTELLTSAMQACKASPDYIFISLDQISSSELSDFCHLPSHGFICEVRCREVYLATGYSSSQDEARDSAMEEALRTFLGRGVYVQYIRRRSFLEHGVEVGDLVLNNTSVPCTNFLPALHIPFECLPNVDAEKQGQGACYSADYPATDYVIPKEPQDFVILENATDAISILTNSANFNNAALEFKIFRYGEPGLNCCKVLIRGVEVASFVGVGFVKKKAAELALSKLRLTQPTISISSFSNSSDDCCQITRKDIKQIASTVHDGGSNSSIKKLDIGSQILEDNLGKQMLRRMGWCGGGIGKKEGIVFPVQATRISGRQGLGSEQVAVKNKGMKSNMQQIIQQFLTAEDQQEIKFSNELTKAERKQLHFLASKHSLQSQSYGKGKKRFLVLRKKLKRDSMMKILLQQGSCGRYSLLQPGVAST